jgi:hypothetical protein
MQNISYQKMLRYRRVISLEKQVGITSQINKWANTYPRIYQRWDQVPRRSKHLLSTSHIRREPSSMIMNAELSAVRVQVRSNYWYRVYEKCQTAYGSMKVCYYKLHHCNCNRASETLTSNETVEISVTSTCLSVVYLDSKSDRMLSRLFTFETSPSQQLISLYGALTEVL